LILTSPFGIGLVLLATALLCWLLLNPER